MMRVNKKKIIGGVGLLLLFFVGITGWYFNSNSAQEDEGKKVIPQPVKSLSENQGQLFYLPAKIEPNNAQILNVEQGKGVISELHVNEGDTVTKGQNLFTYYSPDGELELKEAQLQVTTQEKILEQTRSETTLKWDEYNKQVAELNELKEKYNKASTTEQDMMRQEKLSLESTVSQALSLAKETELGIGKAEIELEKVQLALNNTEEKYKKNEIISEIDGVVKKIDKDQMNKEAKEEAEPFMEILDTRSLYATGEVNEFDKEKLHLGQRVKIIDRKNQQNSWEGKIVKIDNTVKDKNNSDDSEKNGEENENLSKFPIRIKLDPTETPPTIGFHVFLQPLIDKEDQKKIKLPLNYVIKEKEAAFVWLVSGGKLKKQPVELGDVIKGSSMVEIKKGLSNQDLIVTPSSNLKEGMIVNSDAETK